MDSMEISHPDKSRQLIELLLPQRTCDTLSIKYLTLPRSQQAVWKYMPKRLYCVHLYSTSLANWNPLSAKRSLLFPLRLVPPSLAFVLTQHTFVRFSSTSLEM